MTARARWIALALLAFSSCAGLDRSCSSCVAEDFGADWVVVQYGAMGYAFRCWRLHDVSIANEEQSDGIYWKTSNGHLVHISGHYNRVQVAHGQWASALREVGLDRQECDAIQRGSLGPESRE